MITPTATGKFSTYLALSSFAIGTAFLMLQLTFPDSATLLLSGYCFLWTASIINGLTLLYLLYQLIYDLDRETIIIRILIVTSNIPVAFLYLNIISHNNSF